MSPKVWYSLYDRLLHENALKNAFQKVKAANGSPGIDGQSCKDFTTDQDRYILELLNELKQKTYRPQPVKRVEIEKPNGGVRLIGIPTVRDRVVQQALKNIIEPIFNPGFHPSSYGYRPGCGAHDAIAKATAFMWKYLGVEIHSIYTCIQEKKLIKFKEKIKGATRRNTPVNLAKVIKDLNPLIRGFVNYFKVTNSKALFKSLMAWLRRRLRAIQMKHWKKPGKLHRRLRQLGYTGLITRSHPTRSSGSCFSPVRPESAINYIEL